MKYIKFFSSINANDIKDYGGKNASLGEMTKHLKKLSIEVPDGFATSARAYWLFLEENKIKNKIFTLLDKISKSRKNLSTIGREIRSIIEKGEIPSELEKEILQAYKILSKNYKMKYADVAVRSSATAEDLPTASFAGQQESFLNIKSEKKLLSSYKKCLASLFTDRAIVYRIEKKFSHKKVALSVGIQKMVRADKASSGVMFTLDIETGFPNVISISAGYGLGENIVQGNIIPDEYGVFKPFINKKKNPIVEKKLGSKKIKLVYATGKNPTKNLAVTPSDQDKFVLTDKEILLLAKMADKIEKHYKKPMDIEWAKDGISKKLYIVQARPETVKSQQKKSLYKTYILNEKAASILDGIAIGEKITKGPVQIIKSVKDISKFKPGSILVTTTTTPDWVPIMKKASGIITDKGGRTSHAAIVSRELGIPAIVGTNIATKKLKNNMAITMNCSEGDIGHIYPKLLQFDIKSEDLTKVKANKKVDIMINVGCPTSSYKWWQLPIAGIGLARMEFIISNIIKVHPLALLNFDKNILDAKIKKEISLLTTNYKNKTSYFIDILSRNIAKIASSQYPKDVIVRLSDFKSNEYKDLLGGKYFEIDEENPMIGFRGASRYYSEDYIKAFEMECSSIKKARDEYGFENIIIMIPFCRTIEEAKKVISLLVKNGLKRSKKLKIYMMAEIPSNTILADKFADLFDGFSIGSNDLTQLILGIDRDSEKLSTLFDPRNDAIKFAIIDLIKKAHKKKKKVGICGQAPSDYKQFAKFLLDHNIDSISLNPDSVINILKYLNRSK